VISFRKWGFWFFCLFVWVFCGRKTSSSDYKGFVSWKGKNLGWGICDSMDHKADDFGGDFSGFVDQSLLSRQLGLGVKPGEAFQKLRYILCS